MRRLSRQATPDGALLGASAGYATGIVHLGLGNFHRAHAAVYTAHALAAEPGEWGDSGIYGFANRSHDVVSAMTAQDGRYSILELSDRGRRTGVVDVHRNLGVLADDPDAFVAAVADPAHRILTLTVSEVGYCRSARTGTLDLELRRCPCRYRRPHPPPQHDRTHRPRSGRPRRERRSDHGAFV